MGAIERLVLSRLQEGECAKIYVDDSAKGLWTVEDGQAVEYRLRELRILGFTSADISEMFHRRLIFTWAEFVDAQS